VAVAQTLTLAAPPKLLDDRLRLEVVAEEPRIVTPTGIACDERGRLFVIESHTHFPPKDYDGPKGDRIRLFEDADGDGKFEKDSSFAEGFTHAMGIALDGPQKLYVITRQELLLLEDTDNDGKSDKQRTIIKLETKGNYPHNGLSGITFDPLGNLVFSLGENLGEPYAIVGTDGTRLTGGGEGGNIYRCRKDGSKLVKVATGFWNTFGLGYDAFGNLFAVDNDPDSRPPCRLLHIVEGGDYGYRFRNGRKGVHPFTAWNGELPGTLPMVCGTGEAPSGVQAYESNGLPADYLGKLFVTSWGDYRLDVVTPKPRGASFGGALKTVVQGGDDFRPVCLAVGPDGSLYFTDWVKKDYTLHKRGKVWRLSTKDRKPSIAKGKPSDLAKAELAKAVEELGSSRIEMRRAAADRVATLEKDAALTLRLSQLAGAKNDRLAVELMTAALRAGKKPLLSLEAKPSGELAAQAVRWGALPVDAKDPFAGVPENQQILAILEKLGPGHEGAILNEMTRARRRELGEDTDPFENSACINYLVRMPATGNADWILDRAPLVYILVARSRSGNPSSSAIEKLLIHNDTRVRRAAIQWVAEAGLVDLGPAVEASVKKSPTPETFQAYLAAREMLSGKRVSKDELSGQLYALNLFLDPAVDPALKRMALKSISSAEPALKAGELIKLLKSTDLAAAREATWILRDAPRKEAVATLSAVVADKEADAQLRADALEALAASAAAKDADAQKLLETISATPDHPLQQAAIRLLRPAPASLPDKPGSALPTEKLAAVKAAFEKPGDAENGRRIFFQARGIGCAVCHRVDGRGGNIGPDLSKVAGQLTDQRLIDSLVTPSKEVAPQFVLWQITSISGKVYSGVMLEKTPSQVTLADAAGQRHVIPVEEIDEQQSSPKSLMPDGLLAPLPDDEIRDLAAFLRTLK